MTYLVRRRRWWCWMKRSWKRNSWKQRSFSLLSTLQMSIALVHKHKTKANPSIGFLQQLRKSIRYLDKKRWKNRTKLLKQLKKQKIGWRKKTCRMEMKQWNWLKKKKHSCDFKKFGKKKKIIWNLWPRMFKRLMMKLKCDLNRFIFIY